MSSRSVAIAKNPQAHQGVADRALIQVSRRSARSFLAREGLRRAGGLPGAAHGATKPSSPAPTAHARHRPKTLSPPSPRCRSKPRQWSIRPSIRSRIRRRCAATFRAATPRTCSSRTRRGGSSCWCWEKRPPSTSSACTRRSARKGGSHSARPNCSRRYGASLPGAVTPFGAINDAGGPRQRRPGRGDDAARAAQLSPAGQHPHHRSRERRSGQISARDRATSR